MSNVPTPQNFNAVIPAAPAGGVNVVFQADSNIPRNISAYLPAGVGQGGVNIQSGTTYTLQASDQGKIVVFTNATAVAVSADSTLPAKFSCTVLFVGAAGGTVTPTSGTINNAASLTFAQYAGALLVFDGTNWWAEGGNVSGGGGGGLNGVNVQTGDYSLAAGDNGKDVILNSSAAHTFTLPNPPTSSTWAVFIENIGTGILTVSRNTLNIDGAASNLTLGQNQGVIIFTDGSNYFTERGMTPTQPYDVWFSPNVVMGSGVDYRIGKFTRTVTFPANFAGSQGYAAVNPATTQTLTVNKNGSGIGTITITSAGVFTFATTGGVAVTYNGPTTSTSNDGDRISISNQVSADPNMLVEIVLAGTR